MKKSTAITVLLGISVLFLFSFSQRDDLSPQSLVVKSDMVKSKGGDVTFYMYYVKSADYAGLATSSTFQYIDNDTGCVRSPGNCSVKSAKERVVILPASGQ